MDTIKVAKQLLNRQSFSEILPYLAFDEEDRIYALDDGVGFVLECRPLSQAGRDTIAALSGMFESSATPVGTCIQFMMLSTTKIKSSLDEYVLLREIKNGDNLYTKFCKKRRDFYFKGTRGSILRGFDHLLRDFRLFISVKLPVSARTPEEYKKARIKASELKSTYIQSLRTAYLFPRIVTEEELVYLLKLLINPSHDVEHTVRCDSSIPLKDQIVFADNNIVVNKDYLVLDGMYCKSFTVNQFPEEWDISASASFIGDTFENLKQIPADFFISFNCIVIEQMSAEKRIKRLSMSINYQAFGPIAKFLPEIIKKKESLDKVLAAMANKEQLIKAYFHIFIYAKDLDELHKLTGALKSVYRNIGIILQDDTFINLPLFIQSLPMGLIHEAQNDLKRYKTLTTRAASELAPVQADWKGTGTPALFLFSRRGQKMTLNLFDYKQGGKNAIVVAGTGGGKSFFINDLVVSYLGLGSKVWIIDVGGSYKKISELFDGDFITFGPESRICINPFTKIRNYQELLDEHMPVLKSMLAQMASPNNPITDIEYSYLEEAIGECFIKHGSGTTITNVVEHLGSGNDSRQKDLSKMLFPYSVKGSYKNYFEGESNLRPDNNFVVLELEELKQKKDLQEVVLLSLIHQIQQDMYLAHNEDIRKIVIIDEAWDLLGGGNTGKFMEDGYRRFRKYGGAAISITQSFNDFNRFQAGQAIIANSSFKFFLRQEQSSIEALRTSKQVTLDESIIEMIMSVNTDPGNYSEIFMLTPMGYGVGRLIVDRFTQLLYTTDPEEKVQIKRYMDKGMELTAAIEKVIEEESNY